MKVCTSCGTQISEANIVSDVTFQEDSRGAATVQGGFIGESSRHARTLGSSAFRKIGGGERNTLQEIENNGRRALNALCPRLSVPDNVSIQAGALFGYAAKNNFNAGRKSDEVVAACLYAACRRQRENTILLMDISEILKINVFRLGEVYKDLCRELYLGGDEVGVQHLVEVEPLILKYCRKLEFGDQTRQVAEDAVKIIRRMKRDWMVTGRHPAGLCGACIILAARMNNFRRSVREVVWVAKIADATVQARVEEFRRTRSAALTVEQFREFGTRIAHSSEPPAIANALRKKELFEKRKRERQELNERRETVERETLERETAEQETIDVPDDDSDSDSRSPTATPGPDDTTADEGGPRKRQKTTTTPKVPLRIDADGFAIPALPVKGSASKLPKTGGRGPGRKKEVPPAPLVISEEELADEHDMEDDIEEALNSDQVQDIRNEVEKAKSEERVKTLGDQQRVLEAEVTQQRRDAAGITWWNGKPMSQNDIITAEELEAEFADDPEVLNCELSDVEKRIKEQIWITHNEDWLRTQHEKELIRKMAEAAGTTKDKGKKGGKKKKRSKMGDGTLLTEAGTPIETPADATAAMLAKRAPAAFSKYVNYEALAKVYGGSATPSTAGSRAASEAPSVDESVASATVAPARTGAERSSSTTPAPPSRAPILGLESPQTTQVPADTSQVPRSPSPVRDVPPPAQPAPNSPPLTQPADQPEATEGAQEEDDDEDYRSDTPDEGPGNAWDMGEEDDRGDIGEEDGYDMAIDPTADLALGWDADDGEDGYA